MSKSPPPNDASRSANDTTSAVTPAEIESSVLGVVLAGGQSKRMGSDKADLRHPNGLSFLQHAITRLQLLVATVVVSGRCSDSQQVLSVPDEVSGQGPAIAVWSALKFARQQGFTAVLVTPVDMPHLQASQLQQMLRTANDRNGTHESWELTCASLDGSELHPLVAIYPVHCEASLMAEALSPRRSLRTWIQQHPYRQYNLTGESTWDINTPLDLRQSQSTFKKRADSRADNP